MSQRTYESVTTPGTPVTFGQYVVELICLNVQPNLGPRFWRDEGQWARKFGREIQAYSTKFIKMHDGKEEDPLWRSAVVEAVKAMGLKSLLSQPVLDRLDKLIQKIRQRLEDERARQIAARPDEIESQEDYVRRNMGKAAGGEANRLDRIRGIERSGKGKGQQEGGQQTLWEPSGVR